MLIPLRRKQRGRYSGHGTSNRWRTPPKKVAGHIFRQLRRPNRKRGHFLVVVVTIAGLLLLHFGGYQAGDIELAALSLSAYVPTQLTATFMRDQEIDAMRWDDSLDPDLKNQSISTFHLLIPVSKPSLNLCKTLLSASILNFPPPTLIGYGAGDDRYHRTADAVRRTLEFIGGESVHDDDLVLLVNEDTVFQLPAEVVVDRFFQSTLSSTTSLLETFGRKLENFTNSTAQEPRYHTNILFGAQKNCTSSRPSSACYIAPQSPPAVSFNPFGSREPQHSLPLYTNAATMMGTARHLLSLYQYASVLLEADGRSGNEHVFSKIFGTQEYDRELSRPKSSGLLSKVYKWIASKGFFDTQNSSLDHLSRLSNSSATGKNEFGIGLDHTSNIFQTIDFSSKTDIQPITFSNLSTALRIPPKAMAEIHLPQDLNVTAPPFALHAPLAGINALFGHSSWADIPLVTNTLIPSSPVIPSAINLDTHLNASLPLWYEPYARALLRQSLRSSSNPIAIAKIPSYPTPMSAKFRFKAFGPSKAVRYVDLRGGRGGVWTDKGEWLGWNEICRAFDTEVFGDGKGQFELEEGDGKGKQAKDDGGS